MSNSKNYNDNRNEYVPLNTNQNLHDSPFKLIKTVEESIVLSLSHLTDTLTKVGDIHCQRFGITMLQYKILLCLAGDPNIEYIEENTINSPKVASELAEALNVSRPNITNLINLLIEKNLVSQLKMTGDWRKKYLILTEEGWNLIKKMEPIRHRANRKLLTHFGETEKNFLLEFLRTCIDELKQNS